MVEGHLMSSWTSEHIRVRMKILSPIVDMLSFDCQWFIEIYLCLEGDQIWELRRENKREDKI